MQTLIDPLATNAVGLPDLQTLVTSRFDEITGGELFDPDIHGIFIVVEAGDTVTDLENVSGCPILTNPISARHYGDPGFQPLFEYLGEHSSCFELVFIPGDGDLGIVIFIPKIEGIAPELLAFCRYYASPVEEAS